MLNHRVTFDMAEGIASPVEQGIQGGIQQQVSDFKSEPRHIHQLYGTDSTNSLKAAYAQNCLLSRRLLERGVRYVNLYCASRSSGADGYLNWDAHKTLKSDYERHIPIFDQPTAAL